MHAESGAPAPPQHLRPHPRRWLILGGSGAGKSTLARSIAELLGLPAVHLDGHFWHDGWVPTPDPEWDEVVARLAAEDEWVMDGNYSRTLGHRLPRADAVVLLDRNPLLCLGRVLRRARNPGARPGLPQGCPDRLPDRLFLWWILSYRWRSMPKVLRRMADYPGLPFVTLRSNGEVNRFLSDLAT